MADQVDGPARPVLADAEEYLTAGAILGRLHQAVGLDTPGIAGPDDLLKVVEVRVREYDEMRSYFKQEEAAAAARRMLWAGYADLIQEVLDSPSLPGHDSLRGPVLKLSVENALVERLREAVKQMRQKAAEAA